jgi:hypothetical protein
MGSKKAKAVLHCSPQRPQKVIDTGQKVKEGLYEHDTEYPIPQIDKVQFEKDLEEAVKWQGLVKGGSDLMYDKRNTAILVLYNDLDINCLYVNRLYKGNKEKLLLSGYDVYDESFPVGLPPVPVIGRVVSGETPHSVKFYITNPAGTPGKRRPGVTIIIQMAEDPGDEKNFDTVLQSTNQFKLIVDGLSRGREVFFRVRAKNCNGYSDWTEIRPFIPQ